MDAREQRHRGPALVAALFAVCAFGSVPAMAQVSTLGTDVTVPPLPIGGGMDGSTPAPSTTTTTAPPPPSTTPTTAAVAPSGPAVTTAPTATTPKPAPKPSAETSRRSPAGTSRRTGPAPAVDPATVDVAPAVADDRPAIARLRQVSLPAARQFGFPLALAGLVLLFLAVQGRLDARDPKLAAAPLSIDDDLLPFS